MFHSSLLKKISIEEKGFGIEPEVTAKVAKMRVRLREVPIAYAARAYSAGKKIGWKDGVRALWCLLKYAMTEPGVKNPVRSPAAELVEHGKSNANISS